MFTNTVQHKGKFTSENKGSPNNFFLYISIMVALSDYYKHQIEWKHMMMQGRIQNKKQVEITGCKKRTFIKQFFLGYDYDQSRILTRFFVLLYFMKNMFVVFFFTWINTSTKYPYNPYLLLTRNLHPLFVKLYYL